MAKRVTEAAVKEIIGTDLTAEQIAPFLKSANVLIAATLSDEDYGTDLLREIELWLSAHFVAIQDPQVAKEKLGGAEVTYDGKTDLGLNGTRYGQQVMLLDHHGKLAEISRAKGPAELKVLG